MRARVAVADRLADHQRHEPVLQRVDRGRPDAAAGAHAGDDDRVHAQRVQRRGEGGAEEGAGVLLDDHDLVLARHDLRHDLAERAARHEVTQRGDLADEQPAVDPVPVVLDPGVQHRDGRGPGGGEHPGGGGEAGVRAQVELRARLEVGADQVDQDQRRPAAPGQGLPEAPARVVGRQRVVGPRRVVGPGRAHSATGRFGAARPVSARQRSRISASGGPMLKIGSSAGRSAAISARSASVAAGSATPSWPTTTP